MLFIRVGNRRPTSLQASLSAGQGEQSRSSVFRSRGLSPGQADASASSRITGIRSSVETHHGHLPGGGDVKMFQPLPRSEKILNVQSLDTRKFSQGVAPAHEGILGDFRVRVNFREPAGLGSSHTGIRTRPTLAPCSRSSRQEAKIKGQPVSFVFSVLFVVDILVRACRRHFVNAAPATLRRRTGRRARTLRRDRSRANRRG